MLAIESQARVLPGKLSTEAPAYFIFSLVLGCVAFLIIFSVLELYISLNKAKYCTLGIERSPLKG